MPRRLGQLYATGNVVVLAIIAGVKRQPTACKTEIAQQRDVLLAMGFHVQNEINDEFFMLRQLHTQRHGRYPHVPVPGADAVV